MNADPRELMETAERIVERILDAREEGTTLSLEDACTDSDTDLRQQVAELLAGCDRVSGFLQDVALGLIRSGLSPDAVPCPSGFELLDTLGQGGMGVVYRAREMSLLRLVAIKFLLPDRVHQDATACARFLREARALAAVKHDNVVAIYQVNEVEGVPYLVMPLLEGQTLEEFLRAPPRPETCASSKETFSSCSLAAVLRIGREIAAGLAAAHGRGIVHRDVKPQNVWLEGPGRQVKILDFGLARDVAQVTTTTFASGDGAAPAVEPALTGPGQVSGTLPYMSPEQMRGEPVDARSDLFSLGTVLYRMTTGRLPFDSKDPATLYRQVTQEQPPEVRTLNPEVPALLAQLIEQLHAKEPAARPATAAEVVTRMEAIEAAARTRANWFRAALRRRPIQLALVLGVLLALIGGGWALSAWLGSPSSQTREQRGPDRAPPVVHPTPLKMDLDVRAWKAGRLVGEGKRLWDVGVRPLRRGDALRIEATVDRPAYLYLLWFQADGTIVPGYPWQDDDWGKRPAHEEARRELNIPAEATKGFELINKATGVEALVLLGREEPLPADYNLPSFLKAWRRQADVPRDLDEYGFLTDGLADEKKQGSRGFHDALVRVDNPVGVVRDLTRRLFTEHGLTSRSVCFGYRER
jgi:serine/threonine protein kinase